MTRWTTTPAAIHALHDMRAIAADAPPASPPSRFDRLSLWLSVALSTFAVAAFAAPYLRGFFQ